MAKTKTVSAPAEPTGGFVTELVSDVGHYPTAMALFGRTPVIGCRCGQIIEYSGWPAHLAQGQDD